MKKERGVKITNVDEDTKKSGGLVNIITNLVRFTPYLIGVPVLCILNHMCYEFNGRPLLLVTNLMWLFMMTIFWFKYYK